MDTRQMRWFVALGETLHFSRAAERANMSQPAFSRRIAELERALDVRLVERHSRHVALTPAGARFLEDSRDVLARFDAACRDARLVAMGEKGVLRLGFMMHAAHRLVPELVKRYAQVRPDVRLALEETTPAEIEVKLARGELDAAVTFRGRAEPGLETILLLRDRLRLAIPMGHRLSSFATVTPQNLAGEALIAAPASVVAPLREAIEGWFAAADAPPPRFALEPRLQHTILRLVAARLGVALAPASICDTRIPGVDVLVVMESPKLEVVLQAPSDAANPAVAPLLALARQGVPASPGRRTGPAP